MPEATQPRSGRRVEFVGFWYRLGSFLWDLAIIGAASAAVLGATVGEALGSEAAGPFVALVVVELAVAYVLIGWILTGRTAGKWLCSQRIVTFASGERPAPWRCIIRLICWPTVLVLGWLTLLRNPFCRTLHDMASGTCVVADESMRRLRDGEEGAEAYRRPPPWPVQ